MTLLRNCSILTTLLLLSACAASTVDVYEYQFDSRADEAYVKQGIDFSRYKSIQLRAISVWYPPEAASPDENVARRNLAKAQNLFRQVLIEELGGPYKIVDQPAQDAIWLHVEFIDLRSLNPGDPIPAQLSRMKFRTRAGHITLVAELRDSVSEEVLARVADLGRQSRGGDGIVEWDEIEADFRRWSVMLRDWMDDVHSGK